MHAHSLETRSFKMSGHAFRMVPAARLNAMLARHQIGFQHNGEAEIARYAQTVLVEESVPAFGLYLHDDHDEPCRRAAQQYFDCKQGWHLPISESPPMDEQCAALHLVGAMTTSVSLARRVTAYAVSPFRDTPSNSTITVAFPFVIPITPIHLHDWYVIPASDTTFLPTNPQFDGAYDSLMRHIFDAARHFCQDPFALEMGNSVELVESYANRHTQAIDDTYHHLSLRSNTEITTVGSACFYLSERRRNDSEGAARLMSVLAHRFGCNMSIERALIKLCEEQEKMIEQRIGIQEVLEARTLRRVLGQPWTS